MVKIQDYAAVNTIAIPVNTVGTDEGKYVFMAATEGSKLVARKDKLPSGNLQSLIEEKGYAGEQLITEGFQNIYDGQILKTDIKNKSMHPFRRYRKFKQFKPPVGLLITGRLFIL